MTPSDLLVVVLRAMKTSCHHRAGRGSDCRLSQEGKGGCSKRIPLGAGLQAPNCWLRYCALVARLATGHPCRNGIATSAVKHLFVLANSFHEKAGVSQVCFSSSSLWFSASGPRRLCRHPSI